jgi:hypothetical protein
MGATKEKVVENDQKGKEFTLNDTTTYTHTKQTWTKGSNMGKLTTYP